MCELNELGSKFFLSKLYVGNSILIGIPWPTVKNERDSPVTKMENDERKY